MLVEEKLEIPKRLDVIEKHQEAGGQIAAVFPVHYPRSLFRAFDILPVEVWGPPGRNTTSGDAHLQTYACSIVKSGLSFLLDGGLDVVDMLIFPHACDSLQGLTSALLDFMKPDKPLFPLYIPRGEGRMAESYLSREIRQLYKSLCQLTGKTPSDDEMHTCIEREEQADALLRELFEARIELPMDDPSFFRIARSREYLPAEDFIALAAGTLEAKGEKQTGVPILLSGIVPEPMSVLDAISEAGGLVVANDFANFGRRLYPKSTAKTPFRRMADRLLSAPPDSTRGSSVDDRARHLVAMAERFGAKVAIFFEVKFCEPELFYSPLLSEALEKAGLRTMVLEADLSDTLPDQAVTRLEALLETVQ